PEMTTSPEAGTEQASSDEANIKQLFPEAQLANPDTVPIGIHSPKVVWEGKSLAVNFAIQYRNEDGKNQQGKIVVLAYGPEALLTYPAGVLNFSGSGSLLTADKGEYFSVSRFREVKAKFGPVASTDHLRNVDIFLFENSGKLLVHQNFKTGPAKNREPSPRPAASAKGF
ncbi:MAG TPA: hypothetical protein DCS07_05120, partial [Bdellovibrionales bacterium]|nr:hypothetical protein [Bdellovibrionales bacterium]